MSLHLAARRFSPWQTPSSIVSWQLPSATSPHWRFILGSGLRKNSASPVGPIMARGRVLCSWEVIRTRSFDVDGWIKTGLVDDLGPGEFVEEKSLYAVRDPHPVLPHRNAYPQEKICEDANGRLTLCEVLDVDFAKNVVLTQEREKENG